MDEIGNWFELALYCSIKSLRYVVKAWTNTPREKPNSGTLKFAPHRIYGENSLNYSIGIYK
jgi:hypothetical protein